MPIFYEARLTALGLPEPSSLQGSTSVPMQLNIKAVTGACKLIDGCSLELCLATPSVAPFGKSHSNKVSVTLHYITLHYITFTSHPRAAQEF